MYSFPLYILFFYLDCFLLFFSLTLLPFNYLKARSVALYLFEPFICFLSVDAGDPRETPSDSPVRITLLFKDQKSADVVRRQLGDLGTKINQQLQPVFTSKKIADHLRATEEKPPLINQQSVVYEFICDLCDTNYIGYTCRQLHQRVEEHKHSVIGKHFRDAHGLTPTNLIKNFNVLKKCRSKLDCLIYEMLWIKNKGPKLNTQTDSIRAKLFT